MTANHTLSGRTAIVTGAGSGIGAAIALGLAHAGAHVVVQDLRIAGAEETVAAIRAAGGSAQASEGDVTQPDQIRRTVEETIAAHDRIDILVNNAGLQYVAPLDEYPIEKWNQLLAVLLTGPFLFTQAVLPVMRAQKWGRIINIASINGQKGQMGQTNYSAAKAGIIGFTKALAQETARKGITVNCIAPGYIDTEMVAAVPEKVLEGIIAQIPVGRLGKASEIARCVAFLAGDEAGFITGATMTVNGGQYITG
jgi:3-hydroxybutyrate dehydrogenase